MPQSVDEFSELFVQLRAEWDKAEETIKTAEQIGGEVVIPSVQELRYAGRRAIDALTEMSRDPASEAGRRFLQDAIFNCHRARHDAVDVATAVVAAEMDELVRQVGYEQVLLAYPAFAELSREITTVRGRIRASRADRMQRDLIYDAISQADLPKLAAAHAELRLSEPLMRGRAARERRDLRRAWIGVGITGLIALLGLLRDLFDLTVSVG